MTLTPAALTITAGDQSFTYGPGITLDSSAYSVAGLLYDDSVDSVDLASLGTAYGATVAGGPYAITGSNAAGSGLGNYTITYVDGSMTLTPAPLTITAGGQVLPQGGDLSQDIWTATGLVYDDSVDSVLLSGDTTTVGTGTITASDAAGSGLGNYTITYVDGVLTVQPGTTPESPVPPAPPPPPPAVLPESPPDSPTLITVLTPTGRAGTLPAATETLDVVESISGEFTATTRACGQGDADVTRYLACLADGIAKFSAELEAIQGDLPPGLEAIGDILGDARNDILAASAKAEARLATATSDAERRAIRRDAINEAQQALATASGRISKAIGLLRSDDPELIAVQGQTIATIVKAVDTAGVEMSRVAEL